MSNELPEDYEPAKRLSPAKLRDGETPDISAHTRANLAALREHERRGDFEEEGAFARSAKRHGLTEEEAHELIDDMEDDP